MSRSTLLAAGLAAAAALSACGGDSGNDDTGKRAQGGSASAAAPGCIDKWNAAPSKDVKARASLSHRGDGADVKLGAYTGAPFTATGESFDASGSTSSADISVTKGDCVAVDLTSNDTETNWVMVLPKTAGGGRDWYFLDATGDHPLAKPPQKLDGEQTAAIKGFGDEARLEP
jgi:hypothetical protein